MHEFDAGDRRCGSAEMLEAEHRTEPKLDGSHQSPWQPAYSLHRIAAIAGGKVIAIGTMETMLAAHTPWLHDYFRGVFGLGGFEAENTKPAHQQ
jgi:hypothetical protein